MTVTGHLEGFCIRDSEGRLVGVFASVGEAWDALRAAEQLTNSIMGRG
jgi:hypothetical protein